MKLRFWIVSAVCIAALVCTLVRCNEINGWTSGFSDFDARYNEVACSHTGVNPFDVFERKVASERFCGLPRPDMPAEDPAGRMVVHAYPPWHTTFFWFYGWIERGKAGKLLQFANGFAFAALIGFLAAVLNRSGLDAARRAFAWSFLALILAEGVYATILAGNYSVLIAGAMVLMVLALESGCDILAGLCWAFMMVKPQVGMLFFWPLLFGRRYRAIATAVAVCSIATLWPAFVYRCSPVELILQIPLIGKPFLQTQAIDPQFRIARWLFGAEHGTSVATALLFLLCGATCWLFRNEKRWWARFAPAAIFVSQWTYGQPVDLVCTWPAMMFVALAVCDRNTLGGSGKAFLAAVASYAGLLLVYSVWVFANCRGWNVHGAGALYFLAIFLKDALFAAAVMRCRRNASG